MFQRPHELRILGFSRRDYQLLGEVAVMGSLLEQELKLFIVRLVQAPWPDGYALVAHLNFASLADISSALLDSCLPDSRAVPAMRTIILEAKAAYNDRSELLHGPYLPHNSDALPKKAVLKTTARGKIKQRASHIPTSYIEETLKKICEAYEALMGAQYIIEEQRAQLGPEHARLQIRAGLPQAIRQK